MLIYSVVFYDLSFQFVHQTPHVYYSYEEVERFVVLLLRFRALIPSTSGCLENYTRSWYVLYAASRIMITFCFIVWKTSRTRRHGIVAFLVSTKLWVSRKWRKSALIIITYMYVFRYAPICCAYILYFKQNANTCNHVKSYNIRVIYVRTVCFKW